MENKGAGISDKLRSLRNARRGITGKLTDIINEIIHCLTIRDLQAASQFHHRLMEHHLEFKLINTEYINKETDPRGIEDARVREQRETLRLSEIGKMIRNQRAEYSPTEEIETSFYVQPSDSVSNVGNNASFEGDLRSSPVLSRSVNFLPRPPVSSSSSRRSGLKDFRNYRAASSISSSSSGSPIQSSVEPSVESSKTHLLHKNNGTLSEMSKASRSKMDPIDRFIDHLIEGEETCLPGLSNTVSANAALRFEFESKNLPTIELVKFNGDSSRWPEFIENFARRVHFKLSFSDNDRMERLLSVLTGEARKSVDCIGTSGIFYATALKSLKRDFGND